MARHGSPLSFRNVGVLDRSIRVVLGIALLLFGWWYPSAMGALTMRVIGLYPLITGVIGWCPTYALLRVGSRGG